jgi:protein involved in polysaccharide export with SLBB domain
MDYKRRLKRPAGGRLFNVRTGSILLIMFLCGFALASAQESDAHNKDEDPIPEYVLGPGDRFRVRVWGYEELDQEVFIPPSGTAVVYPIGDIHASGHTASELDEIISDALRRYLKQQPSIITVTPLTYLHSQVYVLGEVGDPGLYPFAGKMTVLEAVTRAGNPTPRAAVQQVRVTRPDPDNPNKAKILIVDLDSVIHKGEAIKDIQLRPGDIVYVPDVVSAAQHTKETPYGNEK